MGGGTQNTFTHSRVGHKYFPHVREEAVNILPSQNISPPPPLIVDNSLMHLYKYVMCESPEGVHIVALHLDIFQHSVPKDNAKMPYFARTFGRLAKMP